jgi:hypothetical protein
MSVNKISKLNDEIDEVINKLDAISSADDLCPHEEKALFLLREIRKHSDNLKNELLLNPPGFFWNFIITNLIYFLCLFARKGLKEMNKKLDKHR